MHTPIHRRRNRAIAPLLRLVAWNPPGPYSSDRRPDAAIHRAGAFTSKFRKEVV